MGRRAGRRTYLEYIIQSWRRTNNNSEVGLLVNGHRHGSRRTTYTVYILRCRWSRHVRGIALVSCMAGRSSVLSCLCATKDSTSIPRTCQAPRNVGLHAVVTVSSFNRSIGVHAIGCICSASAALPRMTNDTSVGFLDSTDRDRPPTGPELPPNSLLWTLIGPSIV